jgi:hypothetical protein
MEIKVSQRILRSPSSGGRSRKSSEGILSSIKNSQTSIRKLAIQLKEKIERKRKTSKESRKSESHINLLGRKT